MQAGLGQLDCPRLVHFFGVDNLGNEQPRGALPGESTRRTARSGPARVTGVFRPLPVTP